MRSASPLRYPGGKWRLANYFERLIYLNSLSRCRYVEPYAGGASLALSLLIDEHVSEIYLNDLDPAIHAFWHSVIKCTDDFVQLIEAASVTPEEWAKQRTLYGEGLSVGKLTLGFATFFLNRTNHSGILNGGMIGGKSQQGRWRIDARFNKAELIRRIKRIGSLGGSIHLSQLDALHFLKRLNLKSASLIYLDPPYYVAGRNLYMNAYRPNDHLAVRECVGNLSAPWVVSYDDIWQIRRLYRGEKSRKLELLHTARSSRIGKEVLFFASDLKIPARI